MRNRNFAIKSKQPHRNATLHQPHCFPAATYSPSTHHHHHYENNNSIAVPVFWIKEAPNPTTLIRVTDRSPSPAMPPPSPIPLPYRLLFLYIEPFSALLGTYINLVSPPTYLLSLSPTATTSTYSSLTYPIYAQLAGHLLLFAWLQAVLLRSTNDLKVWKTVLAGMVLCDLLHLWGSAQVLGWSGFVNPTTWRWEEWVNFVMLYGPGGMRIAFCMGVGLGKRRVKRRG